MNTELANSKKYTDVKSNNPQTELIHGQFDILNDRQYYKISNSDKMEPFLTSLVSDCDVWMYISSVGTLAAGRKNPDLSLFPYETDDKLHFSSSSTGPKTVFRIKEENHTYIWEPFYLGNQKDCLIQRNLYKSAIGNALVFEEHHLELNLTYQTEWTTSQEFGIIRTSKLINNSDKELDVDVFDGVQNIMPFGVHKLVQEGRSCLADAYKRCEIYKDAGLGLYYLTSEIVDTPEVKEILKTNVVYCCGFESPTYLLSTKQLNSFIDGKLISDEIDLKGQKGAFFVSSSFKLNSNQDKSWVIVAELGLTQTQVALLHQKIMDSNSSLKNGLELVEEIKTSIEKSTKNIVNILAQTDGLQLSEDKMTNVHHAANVIYNTMRGGYFIDQYIFDTAEFISFVEIRNKDLFERKQEFFRGLSEKCNFTEILKGIEELKDPDLIRTALEFLPISFSRRHGDPSRPWNSFNIKFEGFSSKPNYQYEGNWRDVFQNWEAMSLSYPEYIENIVAKFVNASTVDGFNPYRMTNEGIDWEVLEPHNPWSSIGYWGDHQIIYLLKLLESSCKHHPERLTAYLTKEIFCYANVPYDIKSYSEILKNFKDTVVYNYEKANEIEALVKLYGTDGKLVRTGTGVYYVNLLEKLMVPVLSKLSNFVLDGGIWMNTLRPEWNDANNAIVGYGLSMVTTYYLRRYLSFFNDLLNKSGVKEFLISTEVLTWFEDLMNKYQTYHHHLAEHNVSDEIRKGLLDECGQVFSDYRMKVYNNGFSSKSSLKVQDICQFIQLILKYIDHSIDANVNKNLLFNAYNIIEVSRDQKNAKVKPLYEMFEGQVAALSSGKLSAQNALDLLKAMENSGIYRDDLKTFMLYPSRDLPKFMGKNVLNIEKIKSSKFLNELLNIGEDSIIKKDVFGNIRFNEAFINEDELVKTLNKFKQNEQYKEILDIEYYTILDIYEDVFKHKEFTGRSGIMYKYEGIDCIYWHMNSKLLLATQEIFFKAVDNKEPKEIISELKSSYYKIRDGLGFNKEPKLWGAFPFDPYSHTSGFAGAQQPGMTGQVKEEIITRRGEFGVIIENGSIKFMPNLLRKSEFLSDRQIFKYNSIFGESKELEILEGMLSFTLCQVPIRYHLNSDSKIVVNYIDGKIQNFTGEQLDSEISNSIFQRKGNIEYIDVFVNKNELF